jgi:hypothetical protein
MFNLLLALEVVSDQRWFRPKVSAEYSAETEYSVPPAKTESQNSAFSVDKNCQKIDENY